MKEDPKRTSPLAWILFGAVVFFLCLLATPIVLRQKKLAEHTMTVSHAKHISLTLLVFEQSFGKFPDACTAEIIANKSKHAPDFDLASSDGYFSQIIAEDLVSHDGIFYAKTAFTIKPNRWFPKHNTTLVPGEVGYGYLLNGKDGFTSAGNPAWPILCAPLAYDGTSVSNRHFDSDIYHGAAVLSRLDGSVQAPRIDPISKTIILSGGKSLLDTGPDSIWGSDVTPVIIPPLPAP